MDHTTKRYKVLLYQRPDDPDEFDWEDSKLYGFLGTRFESQRVAADAIAEVDRTGTAERTIRYPLGNTARVVISPKSI